jgi:hypothetical protein
MASGRLFFTDIEKQSDNIDQRALAVVAQPVFPMLTPADINALGITLVYRWVARNIQRVA